MKLILRAEANYDCTTETSDEFLFMRWNKRYCKDCVKHEESLQHFPIYSF